MQEMYLTPENVWDHPIFRILIQKTDPKSKHACLGDYASEFAWLTFGAYEMKRNGKIVYAIEVDGLREHNLGPLNGAWTLSYDSKTKCAFVHNMSEEEWIDFK